MFWKIYPVYSEHAYIHIQYALNDVFESSFYFSWPHEIDELLVGLFAEEQIDFHPG